MNTRGFTVVELVVASAILVGALAAVIAILHDGFVRTPTIHEAGDLQQRARVAGEMLAGDLRAAGAGPGDPMSRHFPGVVPRTATAGATSATADALTLRYVPPHAASSTLAEPLEPGAASATIDLSPACPVRPPGCGFAARTAAVVFDSEGNWDLVGIDGADGGVLAISNIGAARSIVYPRGTRIAEALEIGYVFDPAVRALRRVVGGTGFPLVDNVVFARFEYLDESLSVVPLASFVDGPFRGTGSRAFDVDLLRVRMVRATLRLDTGVDQLRGTDPFHFARPGAARGTRVLPDVVVTVDAVFRNSVR
ncbi:MAG TPA: hypothetical protein VM364_22795 [Vicinamibacterales bacterium]|nr:hypothetical protein [Vicinamibacterales bacterium]